VGFPAPLKYSPQQYLRISLFRSLTPSVEPWPRHCKGLRNVCVCVTVNSVNSYGSVMIYYEITFVLLVWKHLHPASVLTVFSSRLTGDKAYNYVHFLSESQRKNVHRVSQMARFQQHSPVANIWQRRSVFSCLKILILAFISWPSFCLSLCTVSGVL